MSHPSWMLIETFGDHPPTVIGLGSTPRSLVPLRAVLGRGRYLADVESAITQVLRDRAPLQLPSGDGRRELRADPLTSYRGHVHGLYLWLGRPGEQPPARDPAGAWHFNLTTDTIGGSDDLLDLYGEPAGERRTERFTAEAFGRLIANNDEASALAKIVQAKPGFTHQAIWTVRRNDGALRAAHFSCRAVAEHGTGTPTDPSHQVVLRGITHDLGPAETTPSAPPPVVLAQQVLAGLSEPGEHRVIVNMRNLRPLRWVDDPLPGIAWEYETAAGAHWIHHEDLPEAERMAECLAHGSQTTQLRFRTTDRDWRPVAVTAHLVILDQHTTAALLTLKNV